MDARQYVRTRKGRAMAQVLQAFEELIEPHIPQAKAEEFKGVVRQKLNRFESDIGELLDMMKNGQSLNAHAQAIRDGLPDRDAARGRGS